MGRTLSLSLSGCESLVACFFKPGVALAGRFNYATKALVSVLIFNVALGAVAYFYMELQSAQIARLERELEALSDARPKFLFVERVVAERFREVLADPGGKKAGSAAMSLGDEFKRLFPVEASYPKQRFDLVMRQLSATALPGREMSLFAGYTGLLRIVLSVLEDDLRRAGILGDPALGATGDVIARQFPLLIDNAAKQTLVPKLPTQELAAYASGAQLIVDDSSDRIRSALRQFSVISPDGSADFLARFEKLTESLESLTAVSPGKVDFSDGNDPALVSMRAIADIADLWISMAHELEESIASSLEAERERRKGVLVALLSIMFVLAYIAIATSMAIRAGITQLSDGSNAFCAGNLASRVNVTSRDEFAILAMNFNQVADQCNSLLEELRERSAKEQHHLELIVAERTEVSFPRFFVCQRMGFMLPVFPDAAL